MGTNVTLVCPLFGYPSPVITWRYPNKKIKKERSDNILHVLIEDMTYIGTYYCFACSKNFGFELELEASKFTLFFLLIKCQFIAQQRSNWYFICVCV